VKLLEGDVVDGPEARIRELIDKNDELEIEIHKLKADLRRAQRAAQDAEAHAVAVFVPLRQQLTPLYRALQSIFGDLDAAGVGDGPSAVAGRATDPRWASWKQKMPGRPAELIDLLLLHGEMNRNQVMAAMRCGKDVVRVTVSKLNVAGLLTKNGGRFSLKAL
jgi:hypothetical protein